MACHEKLARSSTEILISNKNHQDVGLEVKYNYNYSMQDWDDNITAPLHITNPSLHV